MIATRIKVAQATGLRTRLALGESESLRDLREPIVDLVRRVTR
jgi:hypothetical protein